MVIVSSHASFEDLVAQLDKAYAEACTEGTKKVYNARMILAGSSEAGKTSLANKLLGKVRIIIIIIHSPIYSENGFTLSVVIIATE